MSPTFDIIGYNRDLKPTEEQKELRQKCRVTLTTLLKNATYADSKLTVTFLCRFDSLQTKTKVKVHTKALIISQQNSKNLLPLFFQNLQVMFSLFS